jgi:hypothetical protein
MGRCHGWQRLTAARCRLPWVDSSARLTRCRRLYPLPILLHLEARPVPQSWVGMHLQPLSRMNVNAAAPLACALAIVCGTVCQLQSDSFQAPAAISSRASVLLLCSSCSSRQPVQGLLVSCCQSNHFALPGRSISGTLVRSGMPAHTQRRRAAGHVVPPPHAQLRGV